jgi:hypothetical protein
MASAEVSDPVTPRDIKQVMQPGFIPGVEEPLSTTFVPEVPQTPPAEGSDNAVPTKAVSSSPMLGPRPPAWQPLGLFHPKLAGQRCILLFLSPIAIFALCILLWILLALYFGQGYKPQDEISNIRIMAADLDGGGSIGTALQTFVSNFQLQPGSHQQLLWGDGFTYDQIVNVINGDDESIFAAITVNPGSSAALARALASPTVPTYDPTQALTIVYDEGRNSVSENLFVLPFCISICEKFAAAFSAQQAVGIATTLLNSNNQTASNITLQAMQSSPLAFGGPISYTTRNLHPAITDPVGKYRLLRETNLSSLNDCRFVRNHRRPDLCLRCDHHRLHCVGASDGSAGS